MDLCTDPAGAMGIVRFLTSYVCSLAHVFPVMSVPFTRACVPSFAGVLRRARSSEAGSGNGIRVRNIGTGGNLHCGQARFKNVCFFKRLIH